MATVALDPAYRRVSVEEFLEMDFRGARAELEDGLIYMMAGGTPIHSFVAGNIFVALRNGLRGSGCRTYGSDLAVRTGERTIRLPDVSVYCTPLSAEDERKQLIGDPRVVVEVLSPSTSSIDQKTKLEEYRSLAGVEEIVFIDTDRDRVRLVRRVKGEHWTDRWMAVGEPLELASLHLVIPHADIFARD